MQKGFDLEAAAADESILLLWSELSGQGREHELDYNTFASVPDKRTRKMGKLFAQWVPTWLIIGVYNKLARLEGHDQSKSRGYSQKAECLSGRVSVCLAVRS
jgi:hypothetical protein